MLLLDAAVAASAHDPLAWFAAFTVLVLGLASSLGPELLKLRTAAKMKAAIEAPAAQPATMFPPPLPPAPPAPRSPDTIERSFSPERSLAEEVMEALLNQVVVLQGQLTGIEKRLNERLDRLESEPPKRKAR